MPIGMIASPAHIYTNKKIENKNQCMMEINKQYLKDSFKLTTLTAGIAGSAALATAVAPNGKEVVKKAQKGIENLIRKVKINDKSLMAKIQKTNIYKKFNTLPAPAKAGIAAGIAALTILSPFARINSVAKFGKIEGNFEK